MMGEECPRPGMAVFQISFFPLPHSSGTSWPASAVLLPSGPRHCFQSPAAAAGGVSRSSSVATVAEASKVRGMERFLAGQWLERAAVQSVPVLEVSFCGRRRQVLGR